MKPDPPPPPPLTPPHPAPRPAPLSHPGFDAALFGNVLHNWDDETALLLLRSTFAALDPGGWVVVHERLFDELKAGPPEATAANARQLIHGGEGGGERTCAEFDAFFRAAGFTKTSCEPMFGAYQIALAQKPT